jgi:hypothetical protein
VSIHPSGTARSGVEVRFADRKEGNGGLIVHVDQPGIGADNFTGYEVALNPRRQRLLLARHRNNFEPIKEVACTVAVGRWIPLEVQLSGSVVDVLVDGKSVLRHDDDNRALPAGRVGLRGWQRESSYRNFTVKTGSDIKPLPFKQMPQGPEVSGMWQPVQRRTALGRYALVSRNRNRSKSLSFRVRENGASRIRGSTTGE